MRALLGDTASEREFDTRQVSHRVNPLLGGEHELPSELDPLRQRLSQGGQAERRAGEVSPQMTPSGIVIVMSRRLSAAVAPWRLAQAAGERIQSGMPAGTSNSGISTRSLGAKASP